MVDGKHRISHSGHPDNANPCLSTDVPTSCPKWLAIYQTVLHFSTKHFTENLPHQCPSRLTVYWTMALWGGARKWDAVDRKEFFLQENSLPPFPSCSGNQSSSFTLHPPSTNLLDAHSRLYLEWWPIYLQPPVRRLLHPRPLLSSNTKTPTFGSSNAPVYLSHQGAINVLTGEEKGQHSMMSFIKKSLADQPISPCSLNQEFQSQPWE